MSAPVPATIDEAISPAWLSAVISERYPDTRVRAVDEVAIINAVAARASIRIVCDGPHASALPTRLFVKGGFAPDTAHLLAGGAYYREARFYREAARGLGVGMPFCLGAVFDEASRQGVVVLEDLFQSGATLYRLGDTHSVATAERFVDALAQMHALSSRMLADRPDLDWVPRTDAVVPRLVKNDPIALLTAHLQGPRGMDLPDGMNDPARILAALQALMAMPAPGPDFLLHGDMHLGNIFGRANGDVGWYDWQTLQRGCWAMDLVYYIVGSLSIADRVEHGDRLLRRYVLALGRAGGPTVTADEAAELYRRFLAYGLFIWAVARESIVPLPTLSALLARFAHAAVESETFAALSV